MPTARILDPGPQQVLDRETLESRGWIDVTFRTINDLPVSADSILDSAAELTLSSGSQTIVVDGTPVFVSRDDALQTVTYRYFFTGYTGGTLTATFIAGSWTDSAGVGVTAAQIAAATPAASREGTDDSVIASRLYLDVSLTPTTGAKIDPALLSGTLHLSGAGSENLIAGGVVQIDATTFRFLYRGSLGTGKVTASFAANAWHDSAGNGNAASTQQFALITQGKAFFIELSGGIQLQAAGLTSEPLMEVKAEVRLDIDLDRKVFTLTFSGQLKLIMLGTVGATAGRFVLDMSNTLSDIPQFWGVATIETNFAALEPYGIFLFGKGTLQINTTQFTKTETLTLPGLGAERRRRHAHVHARPLSFTVELVGQLRLRVAGHDDRPRPDQGRVLPDPRSDDDPDLRDRRAVVRRRRRAAHLRQLDRPDHHQDGPRRQLPGRRGHALRPAQPRHRHPGRRLALPDLGDRDRHVQHDAPGPDVPHPGLVPAAAAAGRPDLDHDLRLAPGPRRPAPPERAAGRRDLRHRDDRGQHHDRRRAHAQRLHPDLRRGRPDERPAAERSRARSARRFRSSARSPARST